MLAALLAIGATLSTNSAAEDSLDTLLWRVGACVVERRYADSKRYALRYPDEREAVAQTPPSIGSCNDIFLRENVQVSVRALDYRHALANALVARDFRERGPDLIPPSLQLAMPQLLTVPLTERHKNSPVAFRAAQLYARIEANDAAFGECLVRAQPEAVRRWIVTTPASVAEKSATIPLGPAVRRCNVQLGQTREGLDPATMRGPAALAYFRLAVATIEAEFASP